MIRVDRGPAPLSFLERAANEAERAVALYREQPSLLTKFPFRAIRSPDVLPALLKAFRNKCAYCETRFAEGEHGGRDYFRPKSSVVGLDGKVVKPAYWWLATEWSNLLVSCPTCNGTKGNRFPVVGRRGTFKAGIDKERALILDPCSDSPEEFLVFHYDGRVASVPQDKLRKSTQARFAGHDRGATSIDVLGLNRSSLVEARQRAINEVQGLLSYVNFRTLHLDTLIREVLDPGAEYLLLKSQLLDEWMDAHSEQLTNANAARTTSASSHDASTKQRAFEQLDLRQSRRRKYSVENADTRSDVYTRTSNLARVEIENFRCIERLEFAFGSGNGEQAGMKLLLGENAVGKSSALQAIAMALMGPEHVATLDGIDATTLLRRGAESGIVRLYLSTEAEPLEMRITSTGVEFASDDVGLRTILLGFGSSRWLPRPGALGPETGEFIRVRNLFNPFVPLADAIRWLRELPRVAFSRAEDVILRLLQYPEGTRIRRSKGRLLVMKPGIRQSKAERLDEISDGYQAVLSMTVGIMELMEAIWGDMQVAEGLVLIDELGSHLHPRWKLRVLGSLRAAFPRIQFLATTHEPLCLRGLFDGEILVMRKRNDELIVLDDLPSPDTMRVDQLLTSHLFGMQSTLDPEIEDDFNEYYDLLAHGDEQLSEYQEARLDELRAGVGKRGMLGDTNRDHLIYQIVDEYLANSRAERSLPVHSDELSLDLKRKVADLWAKVRTESAQDT